MALTNIRGHINSSSAWSSYSSLSDALHLEGQNPYGDLTSSLREAPGTQHEFDHYNYSVWDYPSSSSANGEATSYPSRGPLRRGHSAAPQQLRRRALRVTPQDSDFSRIERRAMNPESNVVYPSSDSESFYGRHPSIDDELYQPSEITFDADWSPYMESLLWHNLQVSNTSIEAQAPRSQSMSFIEDSHSIRDTDSSKSALRALRQSTRELLGVRASGLYGVDPSCLATLDEQLRLSPVDSFAEVCWSEAVYEDRGSSMLSMDDDGSTDEGLYYRRLATPLTIRSDQEDDQETGYLSSPAASPVPATPLPWRAPVDPGYSRWIALPHSTVSIRRMKSANSNTSRSIHPYAPQSVSPQIQNEALYVPEESDDISESPMFLCEESLTSIESAEFHQPSESSQPSEVPSHDQIYDHSSSSLSSPSSSPTPLIRRLQSVKIQYNVGQTRPPSLTQSSCIAREASSIRVNTSSPTSPSRQIRFAPSNISLETLQLLTFSMPNPNDTIHCYPEAPQKSIKGRRSTSAGRQYLRHKSSTESSLRRIASVYSNWSKRLNNRTR